MKKSRANLALMGFVTDFGGQILLITVNFITVPIILRFTSQALYGFWLTSVSILGFLALTDFGIGVPLTRAIAGIATANKKTELNRVISTGFISLFVVGIIFFFIGSCFSFFISNWFNIPGEDRAHVISAYMVAVVSASIVLPMGVFSIILTGFQRMAIDNTVRNIANICGGGVTIIFLFAGYGLLAIALSNLFVILSISSINYFYARRLLPDRKSVV